jgi:putative two-component system response regulator
MRHLLKKSSGLRPLLETTSDCEMGPGQIIDQLMSDSLILMEDWDALPLSIQEKILWTPDRTRLMSLLVEHGLLTQYQASRILAGTTFGLVLGSYRVLDRLGAGGMAVVFKAEHVDLRHMVAIKVLPLTPGQDSRLESRFFSEMRIVSRLHHPNIVAATDAGRVVSPDPTTPSLRYLTMEYVTGQDLEEYVLNAGPLPINRACSIVYQIASALDETHKFNLVHRDIKPSNIMLASEDQAKLLDFGLSMHFDHRMTTPGTVLGTLDFMAPEQAKDASTVDIRADLYSLGGTLFWILTGRLPFPSNGNPMETLAQRLNQEPPSLRDYVPDFPIELDVVVRRMMARHPVDRYQTPQAVMQALLPFLHTDSREHFGLGLPTQAPWSSSQRSSMSVPGRAATNRILLVDDEAGIRKLCNQVLSAQGFVCDEVHDGMAAIDQIERESYDLVLLDVHLPDMSGVEVLSKIRDSAPSQHLKVMMLSGQTCPDEMASMLLKGADDYLTKPFSIPQFIGRIQNAIRLKSAQDRSIILNQQLLALNAELESSLKTREADLANTRNSLVMALARIVEQRDHSGQAHLIRLQKYTRALAEAAGRSAMFEDELNPHYIDMLECCVPLHDIGKVCLPDHILSKSGTLTMEERLIMQTHTIVAAESLQEVAKLHASAIAFLQMSIEITRHHHERWDGSGYPDRLAGTAIPLSARIVSICDVYDALRCRKVYKPSLSHAAAVQIMSESAAGQFDPNLTSVFAQISPTFEVIFRENPD